MPKPHMGPFLANNLFTIGGLRAIHEKGLRIPHDIALVAFDELPWMSIFRPKLTVAAQPIYELGRTAASLLLRRIADSSKPIEEVVLKASINIRQSCSTHPEEDPL